MSRIALRALMLALVSFPSTAALAQARTAVLGVEPVDAPSEAAARLADALRAQVRQSSAYRLTAGKSLEEIKLVFGCVDEKPDCMARAGRSMNVAKMIWGTLRKAPSGYNLSVKLLDVAGARVERTVSEAVSVAEVASGASARRTVERVTGGFIPGATGTMRITCNVTGATVLVGGRDLGVSEGTITVENLAPGRHLVKVTKDGYRPWRQEVAVAAGETAMVEATLEVEKADVPPVTQPIVGGDGGGGGEVSSNTGWKVAFWISAAATLGFGGGILGSGLSVLNAQSEKESAISAYHRNPANPPHFTEKSEDVCAENEAGGAILDPALKTACDDGAKFRNLTNVFVGLTAAAAVVTGVFYYKAYIAKPERRTTRKEDAARESGVQWIVAPTIGPEGGGLGLHGRF